MIFFLNICYGHIIFADFISFCRAEVSESSNQSNNVEMLELPGKKKVRKLYSIISENWNLATRIDKKALDKSKEAYEMMANEEDLMVKRELMEKAREFIQVKFRTLDVTDHLYELKDFWKVPHGRPLLSSWFEWVTGGSDEGWLEAKMDLNLEPVLAVVKEIIGNKKGELWVHHYETERLKSEAEYGNLTMLWVFLIREWSSLYQEKPHRVIYIQEEDSNKETAANLPFVHVRKIQCPGEDFVNRALVSVKCGTSLLFEDVGLSGALSAVIEIYFVFNLCFDAQVDDSLNFIQRILGGFG